MTDGMVRRFEARLARIYDSATAAGVAGRLADLVESRRRAGVRGERRALDERDVVLITYGDQVSAPGEAPLATLRAFLDGHGLDDAIGTVHILPFFPYTSDDGFAVSDYDVVDPALGTWEDVHALGERYGLMADLVLNHVSASHRWFEGFLAGDERYSRYFVTADPALDLSAVVRPRTLPLLTPFETSSGTRHVWTTFSADQVDLDVSNPEVLLELIDVLLAYTAHGARIIRLDAVAYLWKEPGTSCVHLAQTHEVVKIMRDAVEALAPGTLILTETNVPHAQNVAYFGDGDEAHMVYQFSLPPLLLDAVVNADPAPLAAWLRSLEAAPEGGAYFNFTASHDGVGVRPLEGLVDDARLATLADAVRASGGLVSEKSNADGSTSPYELNVAYVDAVTAPDHPGGAAARASRFLAVQAFALGLRGVPAVYFHSLVGTANHLEGVRESGQARRINRRKYERSELDALLGDPQGLQGRVFAGYGRLLRARRSEPAFHPGGGQRVLDAGSPGVVAYERTDPAGARRVVVATNFGAGAAAVDAGALGVAAGARDLVSGAAVAGEHVEIGPCETVWLLAGAGA